MRKYYTDKKEEKEILVEAEMMLPGLSAVAKNKKLIFSRGKTKEIFLVSKELFNKYEQIKPKHPYSIGLFFGEKTSKFCPSLITLFEYAKHTQKNKIVVTKSAEKHFTYGNNLEKQMITKICPGLHKGDFIVVCNDKDEALGMGLLTVPPAEAIPGKLFVRNMKDISAYLKNKSI